jgi:hypothetical protein
MQEIDQIQERKRTQEKSYTLIRVLEFAGFIVALAAQIFFLMILINTWGEGVIPLIIYFIPATPLVVILLLCIQSESERIDPSPKSKAKERICGNCGCEYSVDNSFCPTCGSKAC